MKLTRDDIWRIAVRIKTPSTNYMTTQEQLDGVRQMLDDLERLAEEEGCIAAAWALEWIIEATKEHSPHR